MFKKKIYQNNMDTCNYIYRNFFLIYMFNVSIDFDHWYQKKLLRQILYIILSKFISKISFKWWYYLMSNHFLNNIKLINIII